MLSVNNKKIPIYKLDTEKTILLRISSSLQTLHKYLYDIPKDILQSKKIKVGDVLSLIKESTSSDIFNFIQENKDRFSNLDIKEDIIKIWLSYNKQLEELSKYSSVILDELGKDLVDNKYFPSEKEFNKFWTDKSSFKKSIEAQIIQEKRESDKYSELYNTFEQITEDDKWYYTDLTVEKILLTITLDLKDISLLELFNHVVLSRYAPFASCKSYYKILKDYTPSEDWNTGETEHLLLKIYEKNEVDITSHKDMTDVKFTVDDDIHAEMKIKTEKGYLSQEKFIERALSIFTGLGNIKYKHVTEKEVIGTFYFPQKIINTYVFLDLAMNDLLFSSLINIDESTKATKRKGTQPWLYIHFNHYLTGHVTASISQKVVDRHDVIMRHQDPDIFPHGDPYIQVRVTGKNKKQIVIFQDMLSKLLVIYWEKYNGIVDIYKKFIPTFGIVETTKVAALQDLDIAPDVFVSNFSRNCSDERRPTIVTDEQAKDRNVIVFPRDKTDKNSYPSDGVNQRTYACLNPEYPFPGVIVNKLSNSAEYPVLPCCFKTSQVYKEGGIFRNYYFGEKLESKEKKQQDLIITEKILNSEKYGILPDILQKLFDIIDTSSDYKYIRVGVHRNKSSFLNAVMVGLHEQTNILDLSDEDERETRLFQIREELGDVTMYPLAKQSCYDIDNKTLASIISDENTYLDPKLFTQLLEGYFNCNIFTFNKNGMFLPTYTQGYYKEHKKTDCVFIYEHWGSESDKAEYPQCELIIKWNVNKKDDTQFSFPYESNISKNITKIFKILNNSYSLTTKIQEIQFPLPDTIKIESQDIDNYGKTRCVNIIYKNTEVSLLTTPIAPLAVKQKTNIVKVNKNIILDLLQSLKIKPTEQVLSNPSERILIKINTTIGNVHISIPTEDDIELSDVPVIFGIKENSEKSNLQDFNLYKKMSRYITEYLFWSFSRYLQSKNIEKVTDKVLARFAQKIFLLQENHIYNKIQKTFTLNNDIMKNGQIIVNSNEMVKRLMYVLKLYSIRDMKTLREYHTKKSIVHYYEDITDFDYYHSQVILQGDDAIDKWIQESKFTSELHSEIIIGTKIPYFFKNKLVENKIFLAQNTNNLNNAISIAVKWNSLHYNVGEDIVPIKHPTNYDFTLYSYINENNITEIKVQGKKPNTSEIRILGYKLKSTPTYTVLLEIN